MLRMILGVLIVVASLSAEEDKYKTFDEATTAVAAQVLECLDGFPDPNARLNAYMATVIRLPSSKTGAILAASVSRGAVNGRNFVMGMNLCDKNIIREAFSFATDNAETRRLAHGYPEDIVKNLLTKYGDSIPAIEAAGAETLAHRLGAKNTDIVLFRTRDFNINMLTGDKPVLGKISAGGLNFIKVTDGVGPLTLMVYEVLKVKKNK